tara:strand:- start:475 stop:1626 length:1152 start_codon:yes stop_codon:yes gene_type:complete
MTDFEPKTSQKGSGNTSSSSSKKDNEKGFKKVALKFGLDIDENNRIIDTLLEEFKKTGLGEPHSAISGEKDQEEVDLARYITNGPEAKKRVIIYLKKLKEILTYPSGLKQEDKIMERIIVLVKLINPTIDDIAPGLGFSDTEMKLGNSLLKLHNNCLTVVKVSGTIENNTFDGEDERIDIGGYLWSVQFETEGKKKAVSRKTVKDILNLELDYRNYQYQMLRGEGEMTFEQFLKNKHGSSKTQDSGSDTASVQSEDLLRVLQDRVEEEFPNPSSGIAEQQKQDEQQTAATKIQAIQRGHKVRKSKKKNSALCASGLCKKPGFNDPRCEECGDDPEIAEKQPEMTAEPKKLETGVEAYVRKITEETPAKDPQAAELKQAIASFF